MHPVAIAERPQTGKPLTVATSDSITSGIAARYASSLFDLALEAQAVDAVARDLGAFDALLRGSDDLLRLVRSPVFTSADQIKAINALLAKTKIGALTANFIRVVAQNRRLFAMPAMAGEFARLVAAHKGESAAEVTVAQKLTAEQAKELKAALKGAVGKDVSIVETVDPSILGGMIVKIGSRQIDTTLRTKLDSLKLALKEVG
jgi:F-type H+-transporting ATPase subunit delta